MRPVCDARSSAPAVNTTAAVPKSATLAMSIAKVKNLLRPILSVSTADAILPGIQAQFNKLKCAYRFST